MQEAEWLAAGERAGLFGIHDVVGNTGHFPGSLSTRTQSTKRTNNRHRPSWIQLRIVERLMAGYDRITRFTSWYRMNMMGRIYM
jgi:hypothetical protein